MVKSKLELYEEILSTLSDRQLSIDSIASKCNIARATVTDLVDFLQDNQLVKNNHDYALKLYSLTEKGKAVYNSLSKIKRINEMRKSLTKNKEISLPSLAEFKEFARNRLLVRLRSRH
jgi:predicted transcriptional regulator